MASDRSYRFLEEAETDFLEALAWYAERDTAVAERFDQLIKRAVRLVVENPERWPTKDGTHRYVLRRFPYSLAYIIEEQVVSIVAVAHQSRDPKSWKDRR